jgi:hypothetical protein
VAGSCESGNEFSGSATVAWPLKMRPIGCTETSITNYQSALRKILEERIYHLHRDVSLKSRLFILHFSS